MSAILHRYRWLLLAIAAVALVAGIWYRVQDNSDRSQANGGQPEAAAPRGRLGPTPGPSADGHIADQTAFLAQAAEQRPDAPRAGLVSFSRMLSGAEATAVAEGFEVDAAFLRRPDDTYEASKVETTLTVLAECSCIYAVVVEGSTLGDLQRLQQHPEVRLVDVPHDDVDDLGGWELTPIVPN